MIERIAKCNYATLGYEDHGVLTVLMDFDYGDGGAQGLPLMCLDEYDKETKERCGTAFGLEYLMRLMAVFGIEDWDKIPGRTVYALKENDSGYIVGLRPLPTEKGREFIFKELVQKYQLHS